jgi:hypothetical protein
MWVIILMLALYLPADTVEVGVAAHSIALDRPEYTMPNVLGKYEASKKIGSISVYYEHISTINYYEEGAGLNMIGLKYKLK